MPASECGLVGLKPSRGRVSQAPLIGEAWAGATVDGSVTRSGVTRLDDAGRVTELSRMLAGLEDSEYGRAHAGELLTAAAAERAAAAEPRPS